MLPKLPKLPPGCSPMIRSKGDIRAEHDARIAAARKSAHVVTPAEQVKREERAKVEARKDRADIKRTVIATGAPEVLKGPTIVKATLITLTGDERPVSHESGPKLLAAVVSMLRDDSTARCVKLAEGVCLALWVTTITRDPISGVEDRYETCIKRTFYATAKGAHDGGKAAIAEGKCTRFTVADEVRRAEVLAGDRILRRDVKDRRPMTAWRFNHNPGDGHWTGRARNSRANFSHG